MGGCFVPQETLMYWKETRSRKEKRQKEKAKGMAEKKKKKSTKQALDRFSKAKNVLKTTC